MLMADLRRQRRGSVQHPQVAIPGTQRQTSRRRRQVSGRPADPIKEQSHGSHTGRPLPNDTENRRHLTSTHSKSPKASIVGGNHADDAWRSIKRSSDGGRP